MKDVYLFALKNWENACRLRDERIAELERDNAALREDRDRLDDVLASFYPAVAPLVGHYPVTPWERMKDGRCRGSWAEDGSPYYFTVPHQLVPAFFALQRLAKLCRDKDAARAEEAKTCQCTNGVVRSVGRDNEEIIEDCPNCSPSKEAKP